MLRKIRITFAILFFIGITLLFLDFTGTVHAWLGWMARVQFLPALLATNLVIVGVLVVATLLFGRVYCSVICPLGVMQDIFGRLGRKTKKFRYSHSPAVKWLRYTFLLIMAVALIAGVGSVVALLAPYSSYGRIVQNLFAPIWQAGNNLLASWSEHAGNYSFYTVDIWVKSISTLVIAAVTFVVIGILAWRNGRTYCNTVCPVGTVLGFLSRFSLYRPVIDTEKCNRCGLCAKNCKAACIDSKQHVIDYSRCVTCFDCIDTCRHGAISYSRRRPKTVTTEDKNRVSVPRREFLTVAGAVGASLALKAEEKIADGGLAPVTRKTAPQRVTPIVPPGAQGLKHMADHCTACQLCVTVCPNQVLRPSTDLETLMQPCSSYERGYCRPECTKCSEVCPAGAILPITAADKSSIQIGHAVWDRDRCVVVTDGVSCGNCARHCPVGAITMIASDANDAESAKIPMVDTERCIGCGACENLCPASPLSAIYVEGHRRHRTI